MSQQLTFDLNVDNKAAIDSINTFFDAFDAGVKDVGEKMDKQFKQQNVKVEMRLEGGQLVAKEMKNAASAGNKLEKAVNVINGKFGQTKREVDNSVRLLKNLLATTNKYKKGTKELTEDWRRLVTLLREAKNEAQQFQISDQPERSITGANIAAGLALDAIRALGGGIKSLVNEGIQMEVLMIQLKGFTGSAQAAEAAFDDFLKIAAATPFNVTQVAEAARTMMGFGLSTSEATHRVEQLAIVASATGGELGHMARNLGQIQANQRAYTRDLMQFANQGIPIYQMLADVMGVTTQQVREMAEEGQVGFAQVAAALDLMTQKGSAFRQIAEEMDRTIAARLEALQGTIAATAGKFVNMIQQMDRSVGGPLEKTMKLIIDLVSSIGSSFDYIARNVEGLAPLFVALGTVIAGAMGIALIRNLQGIIWHMKLWIATTIKLKGVQVILNGLLAVQAALTLNMGALVAAAAVATAGFLVYKAATHEASTAQEELNEKLSEEQFTAAADSADLLAFSLENLKDAQLASATAAKKRYDEAKKGYDLAIAEAERALQFLKMERDEEKAAHEEEMADIKEKIETEKQGEKDALAAAKQAHTEKMTGLRAELQAVRDRYDLELGKLDNQSKYSKELEKIRRKEIQDKLDAGGLSRKETLELKEQLHQMDNRVRRRELLKEKAMAENAVQEKITQEEERYGKEMDNIKDKYDERIQKLEKALNTEQSAIDKINNAYEEQAAKIQQFKNDELRAIYGNRDAAIRAIDAQIVKAKEFATEMETAYDLAVKLQQKQADIDKNPPTESGSAPGSGRLSARASGGPVSGGGRYQVNELGKEAFLSAAGNLSMINAPAFGAWRAPSSGTVIPAHLTKQLDVPSGGINLNRAAGANAAKAGGMTGMMRAIQGAMGGDTFHQNVTVQAANPVQAANNMMVEMTRLKRRRFG